MNTEELEELLSRLDAALYYEYRADALDIIDEIESALAKLKERLR